MKKEVIIIGGGIIGLCSAYYLQKEGHQVTVIDKSNIDQGASFVNAGYITPSHFIPLAAPGMIAKGIKWMFNSASPFYLKPRLDFDFIKWAWAFHKSATKKHVEKSIPLIKDINIYSRELFVEMKNSNDFDFHLERKGLLMCFQNEAIGDEEWEIGKRGIKEGLNVKYLSTSEVKELEPKVDYNIKGAVYYDCDAHMTPREFMNEMLVYLRDNGVTISSNEEVEDILISDNKITKLKTSKRILSADEVVMAAGTWSSLLTKKLGINIPLQAGKGYRIDTKQDTGITIPAILVEAKVAVTPMKGFTRFAGTMEIAGINNKINTLRVNAISKAASKYYKDIELKKTELENAACGLRPCSPDGLPYIGSAKHYKNLTIATGHAMMGWSLGPATGKLVSEIISNKKTSLNLESFHPDRTF